MCLLRDLCTVLVLIEVHAELSSSTTIGPCRSILINFISLCKKRIEFTHFEAAIYSFSIVDNVTRAFLLHSQSTGEPPNHITKPQVDRNVFRQSANEESAAAFKN